MRNPVFKLHLPILLGLSTIILVGCVTQMPVSDIQPVELPSQQQMPAAIIDAHAHFFNACDASDAALWYLARGSTVKGVGVPAKYFGRSYRKKLNCEQRDPFPPVDELMIPESVGDPEKFSSVSRNVRYLKMTSARIAAIAQTYREMFPQVDVVMPALVDMDGWVHVGTTKSPYRPLPGSGIERNELHRSVFRQLNDDRDHNPDKSGTGLIIPYAGFNPIRAVAFSCKFDDSDDSEKLSTACKEFWEPLRESCESEPGCEDKLDTTGNIYLERFRELLESGNYAGVKIYPSFGFTPGYTCERAWEAINSGVLLPGHLGDRGTLPWAPLRDAWVRDSLTDIKPETDCALLKKEITRAYQGGKQDIHWQIKLTAELDRVMKEFWHMVSELEVPVLVDTSPEGAELYPEYSQLGNSFTWRGFFKYWNAESALNTGTNPLRLIFAHGGGFLVEGEDEGRNSGSEDHHRFRDMVSENQNLYLDSSNEFIDPSVENHNKKRELLTQKYDLVFDSAPDQLLFGSDYWMGLRAGNMPRYLEMQLNLMDEFPEHRDSFFFESALHMLGIHKNGITRHGERLLLSYPDLSKIPGVIATP